MRCLYFFILCLLLQPTIAQQQYNLVPNYSFEIYTVCPNYLNSPPPPPWFVPSNFGNFYYNTCSISPYFGVPYNASGTSYQYAITGNAYIGLFF